MRKRYKLYLFCALVMCIFPCPVVWADTSEITYQAEDLVYHTSSPWLYPRPIYAFSDSDDITVVATQSDEYIVFDLKVKSAGTYSLSIFAKTGRNMGVWSVVVNNEERVFTQDLYSQDEVYSEFSVGDFSLEKGVNKLKFICGGIPDGTEQSLLIVNYIRLKLQQQDQSTPLQLKGNLNARNYKVSAGIRVGSSYADGDQASLIIRARPSKLYGDSYYAATLSDGTRLLLEKQYLGSVSVLAETDVGDIRSLSGKRLSISAEGHVIKVYIENTPLITYLDNSLTAWDAGCFGTYMVQDKITLENIVTEEVATDNINIVQGTGGSEAARVVTITGTAAAENMKIAVLISNADNSVVYLDQTISGTGGDYCFNIIMPAGAKTGVYTVKLNVGNTEAIVKSWIYVRASS